MPPVTSYRPSSRRCPSVTSRRCRRPSSTVHTVPPFVAKSLDCRLWDENCARQADRGDVDFRQLADVEIFQRSIERDLDAALFVDAVAFRFDARHPALKAPIRQRPQDDGHWITQLDLPGLALVDIGQHPNRLGIYEREYRLSGGERRTELLLAGRHHRVVRRR